MAQGLENKVPEIVAELNDARRQPYDDANKRWRPVTLNGYLAAKGQTKQHLYAAMGIDAHRTTVQELYAKPGGAHLMAEIIHDAMLKAQGLDKHLDANLAPQTAFNDVTNPVHRALTPEYIRPFVETYSVEQALYQALVAFQVANPASDNVAAPYLDFSGVKGSATAEGATIETTGFKVSRKDVKCEKITTGIEISYETIQTSTLAVAATLFMAFGKLHAAAKNGKAVDVLLNGNPVTADSAPVIGVTTADALGNRDVFRIRQRMGSCGWNPRVVLAEEEMGLDYLELSAVQSKQFNGAALLPTTPMVGVNGNADYYPSFDMSADQAMFVDPAVALAEYIFMAFMIETEKIVSKQIYGSYASESQCFVKQVRQAAVVLDKSLAYASNLFPAYMKPIRRS